MTKKELFTALEEIVDESYMIITNKPSRCPIARLISQKCDMALPVDVINLENGTVESALKLEGAGNVNLLWDIVYGFDGQPNIYKQGRKETSSVAFRFGQQLRQRWLSLNDAAIRRLQETAR